MSSLISSSTISCWIRQMFCLLSIHCWLISVVDLIFNLLINVDLVRVILPNNSFCFEILQSTMRRFLHLQSLITFCTLVSSTNYFRNDASINTVEEFLDTLINSSRYDRRIRPCFDQNSSYSIEIIQFLSSIFSRHFRSM